MEDLSRRIKQLTQELKALQPQLEWSTFRSSSPGDQNRILDDLLGAGLGEEDFALGILSREDSGALERFRLADQAPPLPCLAQAGIVDLAGRFEPGQQGAFLGMADPQRHLADKGGCACGWVGRQRIG